MLETSFTYRTTRRYNIEKNRVEDVRVVYCSVREGDKEWFGKARLGEGNGSKKVARHIAEGKALRRMNQPQDNHVEGYTFQEYADDAIKDLRNKYRQQCADFSLNLTTISLNLIRTI